MAILQTSSFKYSQYVSANYFLCISKVLHRHGREWWHVGLSHAYVHTFWGDLWHRYVAQRINHFHWLLAHGECVGSWAAQMDYDPFCMQCFVQTVETPSHSLWLCRGSLITIALILQTSPIRARPIVLDDLPLRTSLHSLKMTCFVSITHWTVWHERCRHCPSVAPSTSVGILSDIWVNTIHTLHNQWDSSASSSRGAGEHRYAFLRRWSCSSMFFTFIRGQTRWHYLPPQRFNLHSSHIPP
ncbi:hypothetical protein L7F22_006489 [Adiantum nelumboides]|nr:hypothetical protein [Adiantum nelumboides]